MTVVDKEDARQGRITGRMRYVLAASLVLAIVALIVIGVSFGS